MLLKEWQKPTVKDIVQAALNLVTERIKKCSLLVQTGKLAIKVYNKIVDLKHPEVISEIFESKPSTIFWSNLSDYHHPKTFFAIAKQCSAPTKTVHYLHTMNWVQTCYGTMIFEVQPKNRKEILEISKETINKAYQSCGL